jgi:hypothetical protein
LGVNKERRFRVSSPAEENKAHEEGCGGPGPGHVAKSKAEERHWCMKAFA